MLPFMPRVRNRAGRVGSASAWVEGLEPVDIDRGAALEASRNGRSMRIRASECCHRKGALPQWTELANVGSVKQLFGPQHHLVADLERRVHPAPGPEPPCALAEQHAAAPVPLDPRPSSGSRRQQQTSQPSASPEGQWKSRLLPAINEELGQIAAQRRDRVVDGEDSIGQPHVPVFLAAVGERPQGVAQHTV
jgi:hypothetical protein